jgi:hypothetical protein
MYYNDSGEADISQALMGNFTGDDWQKHSSALVRIVELRGGYDAIMKEYLRITISW